MILPGDLFEVLPTLAAASCAAGITDPPYGIGFMGQEWDTFRPEAAAAREIANPAIDSDNPNLRGRQRRPASSPSSVPYDYSLAGLRAFQAWTELWAREVLRVLMPGAHLIVCGAPRSHHRMMCGLEDAGFEIRDCLPWLFGQGFPKSRNLGGGWGTALKPGHEPMALARKPFTGSTTACHATYGTAGLNIAACRIEAEGGSPAAERRQGSTAHCRPGTHYEDEGRMGNRARPEVYAAPHPGEEIGRWPANVLLDEEAAALLDAQSGDCPTGDLNRVTTSIWGNSGGREGIGHVGDRGGASRFYYVAKPSRAERDLGCDHLTERPRDDSRQPGLPGGDNPRNRGVQPRANFHPTVKPLALMRWAVRLIAPPGGVVLDPFGGSGTTAMACAAEGIDFIILEREPAYIPVLEARIRAIAPLFTETPR